MIHKLWTNKSAQSECKKMSEVAAGSRGIDSQDDVDDASNENSFDTDTPPYKIVQQKQKLLHYPLWTHKIIPISDKLWVWLMLLRTESSYSLF